MKQLIKLILVRDEYKLINSEEQIIKVWNKNEYTKEKLNNYIDDLKRVSLTEIEFIDETRFKYLDGLSEQEKTIFINENIEYLKNIKAVELINLMCYLTNDKELTEELTNAVIKMYSLGFLRGTNAKI